MSHDNKRTLVSLEVYTVADMSLPDQTDRCLSLHCSPPPISATGCSGHIELTKGTYYTIINVNQHYLNQLFL